MLVYFMTIWYNLGPFGIACGHLVHFSHFGMFGQRQSSNPGVHMYAKATSQKC
jgi:hypothetical protein